MTTRAGRSKETSQLINRVCPASSLVDRRSRTRPSACTHTSTVALLTSHPTHISLYICSFDCKVGQEIESGFPSRPDRRTEAMVYRPECRLPISSPGLIHSSALWSGRAGADITDRLTNALDVGPHAVSAFPEYSNIIRSGKPADSEIQCSTGQYNSHGTRTRSYRRGQV